MSIILRTFACMETIHRKFGEEAVRVMTDGTVDRVLVLSLGDLVNIVHKNTKYSDLKEYLERTHLSSLHGEELLID